MSRISQRKSSASLPAAQPVETSCDAQGGAADVISIAGYIADMTAELASLAGRSQLPMLAYFLNLARVEAEIRSRELGGCFIDREK